MSVSPDTFVFTRNVGNTVVRIHTPPHVVARLASTANLADLTAVSTTMDGQTIAAGDVILLKDQTDASENGLYAAGEVSGSTVPLTRIWPMEDGQEAHHGTLVSVQQGTAGAGDLYKLTSTGALTIGTSNLAFTLV
jgi:hypothetical protein